MKIRTETFSGLMQAFSRDYELRTVFDDFLTMAIASMGINPATGKSYDEELYMQAMAKYAKSELRHNFPKAFNTLVSEMEDRAGGSQGNDVLGTFYERNFYRKGLSQYFTPWHICELMAQLNYGAERDKGQKVFDPCCGSGRLVLAASRVLGPANEYYAIDIDHTCVKMAAINLFLNGVFRGEVMCADALSPESFTVSYRLSFFPFGIFRVPEKENSLLWHMHRQSFAGRDEDKGGGQLTMF